MNQILLFSGQLFDPLNPEPDKIKIEDIAHALSLIPRWTGHTKHFYSVAQHSLRCAALGKPEMALELLMHDATEAYLLDMATPIKHRMPEYKRAEKKLSNTIDFVFDLHTGFYQEEIKMIDRLVLDEEYYHLMNHGQDFVPCIPYYETCHLASASEVEKQFLELFKSLTDERAKQNH